MTDSSEKSSRDAKPGRPRRAARTGFHCCGRRMLPSLFTLHSLLFTLHSSLFTLHSSLFTLYSSLFTLYSSLFTLHSLLFTLHFPLDIDVHQAYSLSIESLWKALDGREHGKRQRAE